MKTTSPAQPLSDTEVLPLADGLMITSLVKVGHIEWFQCKDPHTGEIVNLATPSSEKYLFQVTQLLKNEYQLRNRLAPEWAVKACGQALYFGRYALLYPAFSYRTLVGILDQPPAPLATFLNNAIQLCAVVSCAHRQGIVHADIKPANFFIFDDDSWRLRGFGLSLSGEETNEHPRPPTISGTLAYMSPEHTTRTTHQVTFQSDLYSLGIVLYELLTGKLPFGAPDASLAEWVHHHIASEPVPPHLIRPDVPAVVSAIILRLLSKSPEQRYQTAEGLQADLRRCLSNMTADGQIELFIPGLQDAQQTGLSSDRIFTEHPQAGEVIAAFEETKRTGSPGLVVITGAPGTGKSSLIASALKLLQQERLLVTMVKADRHSPVLPYAVLITAFRTLVLTLLGLPAIDVARWRAHFGRLLGDYVGLAAHFIPEMGVLMDQKARVPPDVHSPDARNQFHNMACNMARAFVMPGRPLVIFIDDIHWADQASLELLQHLLSQGEEIPVMLVIAHKDVASLPDALIGTQLDKLHQSASRTVTITPVPLSVKNIARWLSGIFPVKKASTLELAQLIHEKTGGNPLFTQEFFRQAVQDGLINLQTHPAKWRYNREAIQSCHYTENVASRIVHQLEGIPVETRKLLSDVACLGGSGEIALLTNVLSLDADNLRTLLCPAVTGRLITLTADKYAFTHDRVHEAVLKLNTSGDKDWLHIRAALRLSEQVAAESGNEALFRTVHHLASIVDVGLLRPEVNHYRALILLASRRAKNTGDYASSLRYLRVAHTFDVPLSRNEAFVFLLEEAECKFLQGKLSEALELCNQLISAPGDLTDKAVAVCLLAEIHMRQSDHQLALETALSGLAVFGIQLRQFPEKQECDAARIRLKQHVGKNPYSRFRSLPLLASRETEAVMNLLASASMFAAFICPRLHFMIICKMLHITLDEGITGASTFALSWYGVLCGDHYDEYSRGFASTLLARELVYKHDFTSFKARTLLPLDQVSIWTMPVTYAIDCAKATFDAAVANGDRTSACLALRHLIMNYLTRGDHLEGVQTSIERGLVYVRKSQYQDVEIILQLQRDYVSFLRTPADTVFSGTNFTPRAIQHVRPEVAVEPISLMQFWTWLYKGMAHFFAGEYSCSGLCFEQASLLTETLPGHIHMLDFHLYSALSITLPLKPENYTESKRQAVQRHYEKIVTWTTENAKTFADKEALLSAEMHRLAGKGSQAGSLYEAAIAHSREGQFHHINGLAHELAAAFALSNGLQVAAEAYIKGAIHAWERWGATAKVRDLESKHPHLVVSGVGLPFTTMSYEQNSAISDLESVILAVRALTEEINLDRLINTLMVMLLERAGAQQCMLIRLDDGGIPEIEASAITTAQGIKVKIVNQTPVATDMPLSLLSAVIRTGQEIRTGKPEIFSPFSQDPYLVASGAAVMCVPMFKQARMTGVLYLENRLMPDVFTAEHSRVVSMLGAQAAVSLETARLYAELLDENIHRRRVEKQLRASQTSLMLGEKISHTGTWHWHLDTDIQLISDEYKRIMGLPDGQNSTSMNEFLTRVHPDDVSWLKVLIETSVRKGISMQAEFRVIRDDGECRYIKGIGDPVESWPELAEYFGTLSDITPERQAEDAVRIAQADLARVSRATTVGQLTASIAHEINQPLMSIVANAGASLRWLKKDPANVEKASQSLDEILSEGKRAGDIIRGLQGLTRNNAAEFAPANLHLLARDILSLSRMELERRAISLELNFHAKIDTVFCASVQIQQVLLNLVLNAIDAMDETRQEMRMLTLTSLSPDSETVRFEVSDTGTGLSEEVFEKIFDSFYTTKAQGMGMGLTISAEIIRKHGGELKAENRKGGGSTFWFTLPVETGTESAQTPEPEASDSQ